MNIYFAGSIRAGRQDAELYQALVKHLQQYGSVLSEHVAEKSLTWSGSKGDVRKIHEKDLEWMLSSDVIVAEVSTPSLGVGYEIGRGVENKKRTLCLYRPQEGKSLSAMIAGCPYVENVEYGTLDDAKRAIDAFFLRTA